MKNAALTRLFLTALLLTAAFILHAQTGIISGKVFSPVSNHAIAQANIRLINKDSLLTAFKLTDSIGNFSFSNIPAGIYTLRIEALSYAVFSKRVYVFSNQIVNDTILLQPFYQDLQSVVVTAQKPVVVIKPDTTEFNASAFKTDKNATIEDVF